MINDRLSRVLTARERDESNLVLMADILFRFMAIDIGVATRRGTDQPAATSFVLICFTPRIVCTPNRSGRAWIVGGGLGL